jgi:hypothetical protein
MEKVWRRVQFGGGMTALVGKKLEEFESFLEVGLG